MSDRLRNDIWYCPRKGEATWKEFATLAVVVAGVVLSGAALDWDRLALSRLSNPPLGLPRVPFPSHSPPPLEEVTLGRKLFFDPRLSADGTMSCATCHVPEQAFTQTDRATPRDRSGKHLRRNAPTLLNVAYAKVLMHDGAASTLESQVLSPLFDGHEMANPTFDGLEEKIRGLPDYAGRFEEVFAEPATILDVSRALASFQRSLLLANSPFDKWRYSRDRNALNPQARKGYELFVGKAGCAYCHLVSEDHALFSDGLLHNTGVSYRPPVGRDNGETNADQSSDLTSRNLPDLDRGQQEITGAEADYAKYKTPTLRNIALTPPYMHDGSLATLNDVVRFYNEGGTPNPQLDQLIRPLDLRNDEIEALVAFLESLSGDGAATFSTGVRVLDADH